MHQLYIISAQSYFTELPAKLDSMRIQVITAQMLGENAYVLTPTNSNQSLIVDPGAGTAEPIKNYLAEHGLEAQAVLLTHGHADHVWDAAAFNLPVWVPAPDLYRLDNPIEQLPFDLPFPTPWVRPTEVNALAAGSFELVAGLPMVLVPAPGHTEGSGIFLFEIPQGANLTTNVDSDWFKVQVEGNYPIALSGDVVFMLGVGRTDLPGGDETQMRHSLRTLANAVDPRTIMLPGHGYATQWGFEQDNNAYVIRAKRLG